MLTVKHICLFFLLGQFFFKTYTCPIWFRKSFGHSEAFEFTDELVGEGVTYETVGSLQGGRRTWILAKLPERYIISGEEISPYLH